MLTLWAVFHVQYGWLEDMCAGGSFSPSEDRALTFDSIDAVEQALKAADIEMDGLALVPISNAPDRR